MSLKGNKIFGIILIVFGFMLLGKTFNLFYFDFGDIIKAILPLGLVFLGIWMIVRRKRMEAKMDDANQFYNQQATYGHTSTTSAQDAPPVTPVPPAEPMAEPLKQENPPKSGDSSDLHVQFIDAHTAKQQRATQSPHGDASGKLKYDKFMGDMFIDLEQQNAQNVEVSMFIGDIELKLTGANLVDGLNRIIISSFIGDIRVYVPKGTAVFCHNSNFIGDIEAFGRRASGFGNSLDSQTPTYESSAKKVYIASNCFIGDVKIFEV